MQSKKDNSYGVIPVYTNAAGEQSVLLIEQRSYASTHSFWTFPKGHSEHGETPTETALRELQEETGLQAVTLETKPYVLEYQFIHAGQQIEKTVTFYIGRCATTKVVISDPTEVASLAFMPLTAVRKKLTHENTKVLWDMVVQDIFES